jgi:hypothetical protein
MKQVFIKQAIAILTAVLCGGTVSLTGQAYHTNTDIFVADITIGKGKVKLGAPMNITNRSGYDNQPSFTPDSKYILYVSQREGGFQGNMQTDIFRYSLREKLSTQVTKTPESEYSPTVMQNLRHISVVRVEEDSTQRLWSFDLRGANPQVVLPNVTRIGYYAWMDTSVVALYKLADSLLPATLHIASTKAGTSEQAFPNIGRCIQKIPGLQPNAFFVSFIHKLSEQQWFINSMNAFTGRSITLTEALPGVEEHVWILDRNDKTNNALQVLMPLGKKIYHRIPAQSGSAWREIADVSSVPKLKAITRLAVSPDYTTIAFVAEMEE